MSARLVIRSLSVRAVLTIAVVFGGYLLLDHSFAAFDAWITGALLELLGMDVSRGEPGRLFVQAGDTFDVYAMVTGSCSSAAGALGIAAVALLLLPGPPLRRILGAGLGVALFVTLNLLRITSILGLGWWFATAAREVLLPVLVLGLAVCIVVATVLARSLAVRGVAAAGAFVMGVLVYEVARDEDYTHTMSAYHALVGPLATFASLALALIVLWRTIVGPRTDHRLAASSS